MATAKRFELNNIIKKGHMSFWDNTNQEIVNTSKALDLLNALHEENKTLKKLNHELLTKESKVIRKLNEENLKIKNTIREVYAAERTVMGKSVLKQLADNLGVEL